MYKLPLIAILIFALGAQAEVSLHFDDARLVKKGAKVFFGKKPFSGVLTESWPNGQIFREGHFKNGLAEGAFQKYALNGRLIELLHYRAGKKQGTQEGWFEEGPKRFVQIFKDGILDGTQTEFHINGQIFRQITFASGREIARKVLFENGAIFTNYAKRNGRRYGLDGGLLCQEPLKREGER